MSRQFVWGSLLAFAPLLVQGQAARPAAPLTAYNLPLQHQTAKFVWMTPNVTSPLDPLVHFQTSGIKFNLQTLMNTLRDTRHEGWVLAAYPDPKTSRPLIGAGFSLDLAAREHPQRDPLNPVPFLEPSSAQIWQAAGLEPAYLDTMLDQYDRDLAAWNKKKFRKKIRTGDLFPQVSEDDAVALLRVYALQAVHNARAYCRNFDQMSGPQQMALSQLVYQMGVNLEQFTQFLGAVNVTPTPDWSSDAEYWRTVQQTLIQSDWARRYSTRAISVIAMFDATYASDPYGAESRVRREVRPIRVRNAHAKKRRATPAVKTASVHKKSTPRRSRKS
jgi:hypothetical protein